MDFCSHILELKDLIEIVLSQTREISFLLHQFKCLERVFVNYQDHALVLVGCFFSLFVCFGEELPLFGYYLAKGTGSVEKGFLLYVPLQARWR